MLRTELVHSCSHGFVADAALRSLGCEFRRRVAEVARATGSEPGQFAAGLVRQFMTGASPDDWERLKGAMIGADTPLLDGLRFIVENMLPAHAPGDRAASVSRQPEAA